MLERRSARLAHVPVTFVAGTHRFRLRPDELSVAARLGARPSRARRAAGDGMDVIRGFRRLALRVFPDDVTPTVRAYDAAVNYEIGVIAGKVDRPYKPARLVRHGLQIRSSRARRGSGSTGRRRATIVVAVAREPRRAPAPVDPADRRASRRR